jgi:hypothetical protein
MGASSRGSKLPPRQELVLRMAFRRDVLGMDEARARAEMEAVWQPKGIWVEFVRRRGEGT